MTTATVFFTEDHEYVQVDDDNIATVGISDYAQQQLGDIVYVEPPEIGKIIEAGDEVAVIESVKIASEIYTPVSGEVIEVNELLDENPNLVNEDALGDGWLFRVKMDDESELGALKDEAEYDEYLEELS